MSPLKPNRKGTMEISSFPIAVRTRRGQLRRSSPSHWPSFSPISAERAIDPSDSATLTISIAPTLIWIVQSRIDEVQAKHAQERVEQDANHLGWLATRPEGRKRKNADEIVDATLEELGSPPPGPWAALACYTAATAVYFARRAAREAPAETPPAVRRTDSLKDPADDDHRMCTQDVDDRVASEFGKVVHANDRVVMVTPNIVHARFELDEVVDVRCIFGPVHVANNPTERKAALRVAAGQLFEYFQHAIRIESAVAKVGVGVRPKLQLPALLSGCRIDPCRIQPLQVNVSLERIHDVNSLVATLESVLDERE